MVYANDREERNRSIYALDISLSSEALKYFFKTIGAIAKVSPDVLIECHAKSGVRVKAVNQMHSCFLSCILRTNAFDSYECNGFNDSEGCTDNKATTNNNNSSVQTAVLAKHLMGCLRSNRVDRCRILIHKKNEDRVEIRATSDKHTQTMKTYKLNVLQDAEHLAATVDADRMQVQICFKVRSLQKFLGHFQAAQTDVTFTFYRQSSAGVDDCDDEDTTTANGITPSPFSNNNNNNNNGSNNAFASNNNNNNNGSRRFTPIVKAKKCVEISSYVDKKAENTETFQQLQTTVNLDANEDAILRYENRETRKEFVKVTINLKDVMAMIKLCESIEQDIIFSCDKDGDPVSLRPTSEFRGHYASSEPGDPASFPRMAAQFDFDAEMVLAAMLPDEVEEEELLEKKVVNNNNKIDNDNINIKSERETRIPPRTPGSPWTGVPESQETGGDSVARASQLFDVVANNNNDNNNNNNNKRHEIVWDEDGDDDEEVTATPASNEIGTANASKRQKSVVTSQEF